MYLLVVFILLLPSKILCFNINTNHYIVYVDPQKVGNVSSNYFGYTVVLFPGDGGKLNKWVKIGAPKGNDPKIKKFHNTGVVYDCPFKEQCKPLEIKRGYINSKDKEFLTGAWIGGSMDINYKFNKLAICGFRTIYEREVRSPKGVSTERDSLGRCHLSYFNTTFVEEVIPLIDEDKRAGGNKKQGFHYNYAEGEAGFSVHIPENEGNVILGAPGVANWGGTFINIVDADFEDPIPSRLRAKRSVSLKVKVADPGLQRISLSFDLFGYSVTSGHFFGRNLFYAASVPKFNGYRGKVAIVQFNEDSPIIQKAAVVGSEKQFAEYFGAATAAGDLNHDGFDDLMVGAPYHVENTYNEGAVYIFLGRNEERLTMHHTLYGQMPNGQFGSAIMFLGDINNDGFGDLAVGAPYEEELSGVVYIYRGNKVGINPQPCQRIIGKDILPEIRGFGISISRPADMDGNGYDDILVGAYLSGHAVLLRTSPIVVIHYEMKSFPKELKHYSQTFLINICYWTTHFQESNSIRLNRTIVVDELLRRATVSQTSTDFKIISLNNENKTCENVTVTLRTKTKLATPITAFLSYKLVNQKKKKEVMQISETYKYDTDTFCINCPTLDETRSSPPSFIEVPFSLDCGSDKFCESALTIDAKFLELSQENTFVVGSTNYLKLQTTTKNTGELAYSTRLEITLPDIITLGQLPSECYEQNITVIVCNVDNPLQQGKEKTQILNLDMKQINKNNRRNEISIAIRVLTTSNNSNPDQKVLTLTLKREADITISGKSEQQSFPFGNVSYGMPNFTQKYQVEKIGASPLEEILVNITIPRAIRTASGEVEFVKLFEPKATFAGQPVTCASTVKYILESQSDAVQLRAKRQVEVFKENGKDEKANIMIEGREYDLVPNRTYFLNCSMDNIVCTSVLCPLGPFEKGQIPAVILIKMMFDPSGISKLLGEKDLVLFTTQGTTTIQVPSQFIQHGNRPDFAEVSTLLIDETKKKKVALWIIILAGIAGILLLILIIYGLTKVGFFKRTKKEELKNLKAATQQMIEAESHPQTTDPDVNCSEELADDDPLGNSSAEGLTHDHTMNASTEGLVDDQKEDNVFK